jgi:hypothetical protein
MRRTRRHLTYANIVSTLTLFLVLGGGTALAAYVVSSNSQIGPATVSGHKPPSGDHANVIAGSVNGIDVADNSLTGADVANRSGVDTCETPLTAKYGPICVGSDGRSRIWAYASDYCASYGLRLPTFSEAVALATKYDVPGVDSTQYFWTDDLFYNNDYTVTAVRQDGSLFFTPISTFRQTVCVTDPSA